MQHFLFIYLESKLSELSHESHSGALRQLIETKLAESSLAPDARKLLLDAFEPEQNTPSANPKPAYLESVRVRGFRGVGEESELPITPKPGLTLVTGPNGSGKSTFAEGIEIALTGDNARWKERSGIWRDSWRNLHHNGAPPSRGRSLSSGGGDHRHRPPHLEQ